MGASTYRVLLHHRPNHGSGKLEQKDNRFDFDNPLKFSGKPETPDNIALFYQQATHRKIQSAGAVMKQGFLVFYEHPAREVDSADPDAL